MVNNPLFSKDAEIMDYLKTFFFYKWLVTEDVMVIKGRLFINNIITNWFIKVLLFSDFLRDLSFQFMLTHTSTQHKNIFYIFGFSYFVK